MSATIKDIAEYLNISPGTVSRALNGKGRIGESTRRKVYEVAEKLKYVPNEIARSLKMKKTSTIGVIIPDATNIFYSIMLKSIDKSLLKKGYNILFCDSDENIERETEYFELLKGKNVDGMIIVTSGENSIYKDEETLSNIVFVDNIPAIDRDFSYVTIDNMKAAYDLTQLVIDNGHKDIAVVCADLSETTGYDRLEGFKKCIKDNGIEYNPDKIYKGSFRYQTGYEAAGKILKGKKYPTTIFAQNNVQAYGVVKRLSESSINIPDDISIVCFDAIDQTGMMSPKLTSVMQPVEEIGERAVKCILDNIDNDDTELEVSRNILGYKINLGKSLKRI